MTINKEKLNRTLILGDFHFRENLGYYEYIKDGRKKEEKEILDYIVSEAEDCDKVVFLGDIFDNRNNPSQVIKRVVAFIKRFGDKELYIMSGNHDSTADGKSSIDFLKEMKVPTWHIITDRIETFENMVFCPYFTRQFLGETSNEKATISLSRRLFEKKNRLLFVHHAISGTLVTANTTADLFDEIVLSREDLEKNFEQVFGGHIHKPSIKAGKVVIAGSIFSQGVGEGRKYIWKLDGNGAVAGIPLPGGLVYNIENDIKLLKDIPDYSIVKFIVTDKKFSEKVPDIRESLKRFDASILIERYPSSRTKSKHGETILDFEPEKMLEVYAKERKIDLKKLKRAYEIIR